MKLDRYFQSKINLKIIKFFLENPSSIDTPRGIATWINENINKTEKALKELVKAKILVPHGDDTTAAYGYTTNIRISSRIKIALERFKSKNTKRSH
jgi:23S rRNA G2445 N2-methylase RlmL